MRRTLGRLGILFALSTAAGALVLGSATTSSAGEVAVSQDPATAEIDFSTSSNKGMGLTFRKHGTPHWVEFWLEGSAKKQPKQTDNRYVYTLPFGTEVEFAVWADRITKVIRIPSQQALDALLAGFPDGEITFQFALSEDLTYRQAEDGYEFVDADDELVLVLTPLILRDAAGKAGQIAFTLEDGRGRILLDLDFFEDAAFPVVIDPEVTVVSYGLNDSPGPVIPGTSIPVWLGSGQTVASAGSSALVLAGSQTIPLEQDPSGEWEKGTESTLTGGVPGNVWMASPTLAYVVGWDVSGTPLRVEHPDSHLVVLWKGTRADSESAWSWTTPVLVDAVPDYAPLSVVSAYSSSSAAFSLPEHDAVYVGYRGHTGMRIAYSSDRGESWTERWLNDETTGEVTLAPAEGSLCCTVLVVTRHHPQAGGTVLVNRAVTGGNVGWPTTVKSSPSLIGRPQVAFTEGSKWVRHMIYPIDVGDGRWELHHCHNDVSSNWSCTNNFVPPDVLHADARSSRGTYALAGDRGRVLAAYIPAYGPNQGRVVYRAYVDGAWSSERLLWNGDLDDAVSLAPAAVDNAIPAIRRNITEDAVKILYSMIDLPPVVSALSASRNPISQVPDCDTTILSTTAFQEPVSWTMDIHNSSDAIVRSYASTTPSTAAVQNTWNGTTTTGNNVPEGTYTAHLEVTDDADWTVKRTRDIQVDLTPPALAPGTTFAVSEPAFSPNDNGVKDTTQFSAAFAEAAHWTIDIRDSDDSLVRTHSSPDAKTSFAYTWDGKINGQPVPDGIYAATLTLTDEACNQSDPIVATVVVDTTPPAISGFAASPSHISPNGNGWRESATLSASISDALAFEWELRIPDTASGMVLTGSDPAVSTAWSGEDAVGPLEDGVYSATLQATDAVGNLAEASIEVVVDREVVGARSAWTLIGPRRLPGGAQIRLNPFSFNLLVDQEDLRLPAPGPTVVLSRTYNSRSSHSGPLGRGWRHTFEEALEELADGSVRYTEADGSIHRFLPEGAANYTRPPGFFGALTKNADGTFTLTRPRGEKRTFSPEGALTEIRDRNGNRRVLVYDAAGRLASITDADSMTFLTFSYDVNGRLETATDAAGRSIGYEVNGGLLTKVVGPAGTDAIIFSYDSENRLTAVTNPLGHTWSVGYGARGATSIFQPASIWGAWQVSEGSTRFTRSVSTPRASSTYTFDITGAPLSHKNPLGRTTTFSRNWDLQVTEHSDELGAKTVYTYDSNGNRTSITDPLGHTRTFTYDTAGNRLSETSARGSAPGADPAAYTTTYTYDTVGNQTSATDPLGHTRTFTYDTAGNRLTETSPRGNLAAANPADYTTTYTYDANGNQTTVTDPLGNTRTYTYDTAGNRLTETSPRGNLAAANPADYTTTYTYDANGNQTSVTDPLGHKTTHVYAPDGLLTVTTDARGARRILTHDAAGRVTVETRDLDSSEVAITRYSYDPAGRRTKVVDPRVDGEPGSFETLYAYDAAGQLVSETDPLGNKTTHAYDPDGNRVQVVDPRGNAPSGDPEAYVTRYEYDAAGQMTSTTIPAQGTTTYTYDPDGNRILVTDPLGASESSEYDTSSRLTAVTDADGGRTSYTYDPDGNRTALTEPRGHVAGADPNDYTTRFIHDASGRMLAETLPLGQTATHAFDADGNRIATVDPRGNEPGADSADFTWSYTFDAKGQLTKVTDPMGRSSTYTYGPTGMRTSKTDASGTTNYGYDLANRPIRTTYPQETGSLITANEVRRSFDASDNLIGVSEHVGTTAYVYDQAQQLSSGQGPYANTESIAYDPAGNRTEIHFPSTTHQRHWRPDNHQAAWENEYAKVEMSSYDPAGRLLAQQHYGPTTPTTLREEFGYSPGGRLTETRLLVGDHTIQDRLQAHYDPSGRIQAIIDPDTGQYRNLFTHDSNGRVVQEQINTANGQATISYGYDGSGNRIERAGPDGSTAYIYDRSGRLLEASTDAGVTTTYTHDDNGNLVEANDSLGRVTTYGWDTAGRLASWTRREGISTTSIAYSYSEDGRLVERRTPSRTFRYRYEGERLESIVDELNRNILTFAYGESDIPTQIHVPRTVPTLSPRVFAIHTSPDGSLANIIRSDGALAVTYHYDAYGSEIWEERGEAWVAALEFNPYRIQGYLYDAEASLYNSHGKAYHPRSDYILSKQDGRPDLSTSPQQHPDIHDTPPHDSHLPPGDNQSRVPASSPSGAGTCVQSTRIERESLAPPQVQYSGRVRCTFTVHRIDVVAELWRQNNDLTWQRIESTGTKTCRSCNTNFHDGISHPNRLHHADIVRAKSVVTLTNNDPNYYWVGWAPYNSATGEGCISFSQSQIQCHLFSEPLFVYDRPPPWRWEN